MTFQNPFSTNDSPRSSAAKSPRYLTALGWAVTLAIAFFSYMNIAPYEAAIRLLFETSDTSGLAAFVLQLPVIGFLAKGATNLFGWLMGAVLWLVIQILELLPLLLFNSRRALKSVIKRGMNGDTFQVSDNDDPALANLKKAYNRLPYRIVRQFRQFALFAYVVDLLICLTVYPPVDGGFSKLFLIVTTGALQLVNWRNVIMLIVTLFAVEVLLQVAFMVSNLRATLAGGSQND